MADDGEADEEPDGRLDRVDLAVAAAVAVAMVPVAVDVAVALLDPLPVLDTDAVADTDPVADAVLAEGDGDAEPVDEADRKALRERLGDLAEEADAVGERTEVVDAEVVTDVTDVAEPTLEALATDELVADCKLVMLRLLLAPGV